MGPSSTAHWLDCAKTKAATFFSHKWNFNFSLRCLLNSPSSWPVLGKMRQVRVFALTSVCKFHCGHEFHLTQKPYFPAGTFQQALQGSCDDGTLLTLKGWGMKCHTSCNMWDSTRHPRTVPVNCPVPLWMLCRFKKKKKKNLLWFSVPGIKLPST